MFDFSHLDPDADPAAAARARLNAAVRRAAASIRSRKVARLGAHRAASPGAIRASHDDAPRDRLTAATKRVADEIRARRKP